MKYNFTKNIQNIKCVFFYFLKFIKRARLNTILKFQRIITLRAKLNYY